MMNILMNIMIIPLTISYLVLLGAAAPVADDQAHSHPLQKRSVLCDTFYGRNVHPVDCQEALGKMQRMPTVDMNPQTGRLVPLYGHFSRDQPDGRFRLPQAFKQGTCTIIVGLSNPAGTITSGWGQVSAGARWIIDECVHGPYTGGVDNNRNGFDTVVLNEQTADPRLGAWPGCVDTVESHHLLNPEAQCLFHEFEMSAAASLARPGRGTSKQ